MKLIKKSILYSSISTSLMLAVSPVTHAQQQGTVTDQEGNSYKTVVINGKTWMSENLRATKFNDGTPIKTATIGAQDTAPAMYWYNNDKNSAQSKEYGALYNWKVITSKNVCPVNWHVSTLDEWNELINSYPQSDKARGEKDGKYAAYPLRATGGSWPSNQAATNASGFSALPGGWIANAGHMTWVGERGAWWAPKNNNAQPAFGKIAMADDGAWTFDANVIDILTIRCVQDTGSTQSVVPGGYFKLTTQFRESNNECLEGNQVKGSMNGAAFMDKCQNVSGQSWKAIPAENGYFKLTTKFREGNNECLEGNQVKGSMNGAAFMDKCQAVSGQLWKAIPAGNGYFKLTTKFREGNNECLEGNQVKGSMNGAAFMDKCQAVSGQLWKFQQ